MRTTFHSQRLYHIVEKKNPLAIHGIFDTQERAQRHLSEVIPEYAAKGYFMDKTLRAEDFEIIPAPSKNRNK